MRGNTQRAPLIVAAAMATTAVLALAAARADAADYYAGKTVTVAVGQAPGGGSDIYCRMISQYLTKFVAGHPTFIVKNMPSQNSTIALNFAGRQAKPDGLTAFCGGYDPTSVIVHNSALLVDLTKFDFILGQGSPQITYMRRDVPPGLATAEDLFKVNPHDIILGGFAVNGFSDLQLRVPFQMMGIEGYRYVTGFAGGPQLRAAVEQKFVNVVTEGIISYAQVTNQTLIKTGEALPLFQIGVIDASGHLTARDPRAPAVPNLYEFYSHHFGHPPSGTAWDLEEAMAGYIGTTLFSMMLTPGSPPEAVAAMRDAVDPLNHDPDFVSVESKVSGPGVVQQSGAVALARLQALATMRPDMIQLYNDMVRSGEGIQEKH